MASKRIILLLLLRALFFMIAAGFIAVRLREFLYDQWHVAIPPTLYGVMGLLFIWLVFWLSTRRLFSEVKANAKPSKKRDANDSLLDHGPIVGTVHRYPARLRYMLTFLGLSLLAVPFIGKEPGRPIAFVTFAICIMFACIVFAIDFYIYLYAVVTTGDGVVIKFLGKRTIPFSDMTGVEIVRTKNAPQIVLSLKSGQVVRFGGMLSDFSRLSGALSARLPRQS